VLQGSAVLGGVVTVDRAMRQEFVNAEQ